MRYLIYLLDVVGVGCIAAGAALVYAPAGLIVGGLLCLGLALAAERRPA